MEHLEEHKKLMHSAIELHLSKMWSHKSLAVTRTHIQALLSAKVQVTIPKLTLVAYSALHLLLPFHKVFTSLDR